MRAVFTLAGFILGEGMLKIELQIVAVLRRQSVQQRHILLLAPGAAGETDQAEGRGAGTKYHCIARLGFQMFLGCRHRHIALTGEDEVVASQIIGLARRQFFGRGISVRHGGAGGAGLAVQRMGTGLSGIVKRETWVGRDSVRKGVGRTGVARKLQIATFDIGIARGG